MSFLGGYGQMNSENMYGGGMYSGGFDYSQFGWGFPGGDFNAWGNSAAMPQTSGSSGRKDDHSQGYDQGYYGMGQRDYGNINGDMERNDGGVKAVEQGLKGVSLNDKHDVTVKETGHQSSASQGHSQAAPSGPKKMTWASIASQPARPQPQMKPKSIPRAPVLPGKHGNIEIGTWEGKNNASKAAAPPARGAWSGSAPRGRTGVAGPYSSGGASAGGAASNSNSGPSSAAPAKNEPSHPLLDKLKSANQYNPKDFNLNPKGARYFIIKSYSEDDIHRSIKYSIWCSTEHGNKRLDSAYREREGKGPVYLLYSVNGSGHFCGIAQMMSAVDYGSSSSVWAQDKWKGQFEVKWIYVKDVPNSQLRHIRLENNENKPVTNSRDTQEVPPEKGKQVLKIIHHYRHTTSIFDDFTHYEKRQEEDGVDEKKN